MIHIKQFHSSSYRVASVGRFLKAVRDENEKSEEINLYIIYVLYKKENNGQTVLASL